MTFGRLLLDGVSGGGYELMLDVMYHNDIKEHFRKVKATDNCYYIEEEEYKKLVKEIME